MPSVHHHGLAESVEAELRGVVGRSPREGVLAGQTADVYHVPSASPLKSRQRLAAAVKNTRQIRLERPLPIFYAQIRGALEDPYSSVVHQDVETAQALIHEFKKLLYV